MVQLVLTGFSSAQHFCGYLMMKPVYFSFKKLFFVICNLPVLMILSLLHNSVFPEISFIKKVNTVKQTRIEIPLDFQINE